VATQAIGSKNGCNLEFIGHIGGVASSHCWI